MKNRSLLCPCAVIVALLVAAGAHAQSAPASDIKLAAVTPAASKSAPQTVALIAAIGDQLQWVRQKSSTGSHMEPFTRRTVILDTQALNYSVLRGLARAVSATEPETTQVLLRFSPTEQDAERLKKAKNSEREKEVFDILRDRLQAMPDRMKWDRIIAVTPKYMYAEGRGMASKLNGIGVYEQPLERNGFTGGDISTVSPVGAEGDDTTYGPGEGAERKKTASSRYVAPYFYFTITTFDARTLQVLKQESRWDYIKMYDPDSTALDVRNMFSAEQLIDSLSSLVERSSRRVIAGEGVVDVGAVKRVDEPAQPAKK